MTNRARFFGRFLELTDIVLTLVALLIADVLRHVLPFGAGEPGALPWLTMREYLIVAVIWAFFLRFAHLYDHRRLLRIVDETRAIIPAILVATGALFAAFFIIKVEFLSRLLFVYFIAINLLLLIHFRWEIGRASCRERV